MKAYHFDQFKDFFEFQMREKATDRRGRKKTTLHQLAKKLGYNSASSLSMISKGDRLPSQSLLEGLFEEWNITSTDRDRIRLQVEIEKRNRNGKNPVQLIAKLNQLTPYHKIDINHHLLIRDWYVLIIKILAGCPQFSEDPQIISQKLRKKITPLQAKKALELLVETGLLKKDPVTLKISPAIGHIETSHEISDEAIRENHKGMIKRAYEAIEEQSIKQRHYNSLSVQFDMKRMPQAKQKILDFVKQFNEEFNAEDANQIYQLNVQLFEHSNGGTNHDV